MFFPGALSSVYTKPPRNVYYSSETAHFIRALWLKIFIAHAHYNLQLPTFLFYIFYCVEVIGFS